ncbi:MAG TPA: peptidylprolyl isomerase [Pirellulaceae bacterium]|nr:peptidylprolyl isomerase [Pirellulaceae bacterium]
MRLTMHGFQTFVVFASAVALSGFASAQPPATKAPATKTPAANKAPKTEQPPPTVPPATVPAAAPAEANAKGPAAAEYQRLMEEWKTVLKDLRKLKLQYQSTALADQAKVQQEWTSLVDKGNETVAALEAAGVKAYAEAPNEDPQLTRFLVKLADDAIGRDDYAAAKRITDVLIEYQCPDKQIYDSAAIAAFVLNDYDQAEKYFKLAKDAGVLSSYGKELEPSLPEYKDLWAKEKAIRDAEAKADDLPRVKLTTTKGTIVLELFENESPETVGNFVSLVEGGKYDNLTFHRVLKNFMAQGGDPKGDGSGGPGYHIYCECYKPEYRRHFQGSLSMAHAGRDTGGSQFFLTFKQTPHLNGKHTCFGRVIEGMDVLSKLKRRDPQAASPTAPDSIVKAEVIRKRDHVYQPHKVE